MGKTKFKTLEEAQTAYDNEVQAHTATKEELEVAKQTALEAINQSNEASAASPKVLEAKVGSNTYTVNFGVEHNGKVYTAEEISADADLAKELVNIGSGALTVKEG